jgi:hypothetical protein
MEQVNRTREVAQWQLARTQELPAKEIRPLPWDIKQE